MITELQMTKKHALKKKKKTVSISRADTHTGWKKTVPMPLGTIKVMQQVHWLCACGVDVQRGILANAP